MIPPGAFPRLTAENHRVTSPASREYNCIAWAAGDTAAWWWPDAEGVGCWPPGVPREETVDAFIRVYQDVGYETCADSRLEPDFDKVAIYAVAGKPTHAARQLPSGLWSSKLGAQQDIEHELAGLEGSTYGSVVALLRRARAANK